MTHEPQGPWLTLLLRHLPPGSALGWDDLLVGHDFGFVAPAEIQAWVAAQALPGVLGSRMMGAGFGGCTINLVREPDLEGFQAGMAEVYRARLGREPLLHVCRLTAGTGAQVLEPHAVEN